MLSVVVLVFNEEKHIGRCLSSVKDIADEIIVIDSFSSDRTAEIAKRFGAKVFQNTWVNYAIQFNFGLSKVSPSSHWVMRMDADEYLTNDLVSEIQSTLPSLEQSINGLYIKRRVHFMNKWISKGDYYPIWLLRIWRNQQGVCEERWMDEHIKLTNPNTIQLSNDLVDDNKNSLTWWTEKHNNYATREAIDLLNLKYNLFEDEQCLEAKIFGNQEQRKRWLKNKYARFPLFVRPFLYFIYRYFLKLGFLDGKQGFIWHFLQGFWYRFLVDAKIFDIERRSSTKSKDEIIQVLINIYKVKGLES